MRLTGSQERRIRIFPLHYAGKSVPFQATFHGRCRAFGENDFAKGLSADIPFSNLLFFGLTGGENALPFGSDGVVSSFAGNDYRGGSSSALVCAHLYRLTPRHLTVIIVHAMHYHAMQAFGHLGIF